MTHLTISEDSGEEFALRGHNTVIDEDEDAVVFYSDVTKVHVVPKQNSFTIQVLTPEVVIEMDFADVNEVHEALSLFETKKVLEVDFDDQNSVASSLRRCAEPGSSALKWNLSVQEVSLWRRVQAQFLANRL